MSGAGVGAALLVAPRAEAPAGLRAKVTERLHRRLDLAGARPEQPVRVLLVAATGAGEGLAAFGRARGWKVERRGPGVLVFGLPAEAFDGALVAEADRWVAADIAEKLVGLPVATEETVAEVAIAAPEHRWPELRGLGLGEIGAEGGRVTGRISGAAFAGLCAAGWIEAIEVRSVDPAWEEPITEDEELDPSAEPVVDDGDDDPAEAIGPPIESEE